MTQKQSVLKYMKEHGKITTLEAAISLYIVDLRKIISSLIADGVKINKTNVRIKDKQGKVIGSYTEYSLPEVTK